MRYLLWAFPLAALSVSAMVLAADPATTQPAPATRSAPASQPFDTDLDKVSYSLGMKIARNIRRDMPDISVDAFTRGIRDTLAEQTLLSDLQATQALDAYTAKMQIRQENRLRDPAQFNKEEGAAFLARNARKPGVIVTPSGLQYKVLQEGTGPRPKDTDIVRVRYSGTFIDGNEFDSSHGKPAPFRVTGVIPGWTEALQMMPVGSKWQLFVPSNLAYGERGADPLIGPNATLIFEMELVDIK